MKGNLFLIMLGIFLLTACTEEYFLFDSPARIQFGPEPEHIYQANYNFRDTLKAFTFVYSDPLINYDTLYYDVYALGGATDNDRPFRLEQVQVADTLNALADKHYVAFNDPQMREHYVIRAGRVHARVPIVMIRDASLQEDGVMLKFQLVNNEHFELGDVRLSWRKAFFVDKITQPPLWDDFLSSRVLGPYSTVKHLFMVQQTGERWDNEFLVAIYSEFSTANFWNARLKQLLIDYNAANPGNPLTDEFGQLVFFP